MTSKEKYLTESNIDSIADSLLGRISQLTDLHQLPELTGTSALLIIDMQDYFLDEESHAYVPSSGTIIPRIVRLAEAYQKSGNPVIFTKHINTNSNAGMMKNWWRDIITVDNPSHNISSAFRTSDGLVIEKSQYDAFLGTDLHGILKKLEVKSVAITGVMTNLCCEATARSAFARGYEVIVPVDTTAAYNLQFHFSSLLNLAYGFAYVPHSIELINKMSSNR